MNSVMRTIRDSDAKIVSQSFDNTCTIALSVRADRVDALTDRISSIDGTSIQSIT